MPSFSKHQAKLREHARPVRVVWIISQRQMSGSSGWYHTTSAVSTRSSVRTTCTAPSVHYASDSC